MRKVQISASILSADFSQLGKEIELAMAAGVDWIHFDVMDHHFVPNLSFGPVICASLRKAGVEAPIDVHLMVEKPEQYIEPFAQAGANLISFHPETTQDTAACLQHIHAHGMSAGLVLNPDKPLSLIKDHLNSLELILIMSVYPGFGGQSFIEDSIEKIRQTRQLINATNPQIKLGIDGGIKDSNIVSVADAGADFCIVGSGLFHSPNYEACIHHMRLQLQKAGLDGTAYR